MLRERGRKNYRSYFGSKLSEIEVGFYKNFYFPRSHDYSRGSNGRDVFDGHRKQAVLGH